MNHERLSLANGMFHLARILAGPHQDWVAAIQGEMLTARAEGSGLAWAAGVVPVLFRIVFRRLVEGPSFAVAAVAIGCSVAWWDLNSAERWPAAVATATGALVLGFLNPVWPWRWAILLPLCLPVVVQVTNNAGPYEYDRFDMLYPLPLAVLAALLGAHLRNIGRRLAA